MTKSEEVLARVVAAYHACHGAELSRIYADGAENKKICDRLCAEKQLALHLLLDEFEFELIEEKKCQTNLN